LSLTLRGASRTIERMFVMDRIQEAEGFSRLDELEALEPSSLSSERLEEGFCDIQRSAQALEALRMRWLAEIERRKTFARDGHLSASSWLAARFKVAFPAAAQQVRTAVALEEMPEVREALASGVLSGSAVTMLVAARESAPKAFSESAATLVQAAQSLPARELRFTVGQWRDRVDAGAARG
jgi:hypothetical protein